MFDEKFRAVFPTFAKGIVKLLIKSKITPNQITFFAFVLALCACYLICKHSFVFGIAVWWLSRLFDGLDGLLAREINQKTAFGGYLDILLDMAAYSAMIFAFSFVYPNLNAVWNLILIFYVLCITSTLALSSIVEGLRNSNNQHIQEILQNNNRSLKFTTGLAEGGETSIAYTFMALLPLFSIESLVYISVLWVCMVMLTVLQRSYLAFKILKGL